MMLKKEINLPQIDCVVNCKFPQSILYDSVKKNSSFRPIAPPTYGYNCDPWALLS